MGTQINFKFPRDDKVISLTVSRELTVIESCVINSIAKGNGNAVVANVFTKLEHLTGQRPRIELLTIAEFEHREKHKRQAEGDDDASEAA